MEKITNASDHLIRATLIALCNDSDIRNKAEEYIDKMTSLQEDAAHENAGGHKRKAESTIKICVQCQDSFYEEDNGPRACRYHDGELEIDDEHSTWDDWDENCFGRMDSEDNREEYPDGFTWNCCNKRGTDLGCTRGPHKTVDATRGRYGDKSDDSEDDSGEIDGSEEDE
ncbi:hypothetical protein F5X99DRAFT_408671 [Biscogniauxia marginata]|nr:hypothetical protein F5X99DRAFT_408671 [Biscogniauxia marginata]